MYTSFSFCFKAKSWTGAAASHDLDPLQSLVNVLRTHPVTRFIIFITVYLWINESDEAHFNHFFDSVNDSGLSLIYTKRDHYLSIFQT